MTDIQKGDRVELFGFGYPPKPGTVRRVCKVTAYVRFDDGTYYSVDQSRLRKED